jgi:4,5-dihydroxyphthalate decarboxylase
VPLTLLPAVLVARFQHPYIVYNAAQGELTPQDLSGRRIGIRSYTVTTVTWVRGILVNDFGVDLDSIKWITFEDAHVAGVDDPLGVERATDGKTLEGMLIAGEIDAAIVGAPMDHPDIRTLFPDPATAAEAWRAKNGAIQLNHLVAVKSEVARSYPVAVREIYRQLLESRRAAGLPSSGGIDLNPFGIEANRRNLEVAIDYVYAQGLISQRFAVDELFDDAVREA